MRHRWATATRVLTSAVLSFCVLPQVLHAQQVRPAEPLSVPVGELLRCTRPPIAPANGMDVREFIIGAPDTSSAPDAQLKSRKVTVAADSLGHLRFVMEEFARGWDGVSVTLRLILPDTLLSLRQEVTVDSTAMARALTAGDVAGVKASVANGVRRPLTAMEREHADSLASWLWVRRCFRE